LVLVWQGESESIEFFNPRKLRGDITIDKLENGYYFFRSRNSAKTRGYYAL